MQGDELGIINSQSISDFWFENPLTLKP